MFEVVHPLYETSEAVIYWFKTYHRYHKGDLKLNPSVFDSFYGCTIKFKEIKWLEGESPRGICFIQTDDTAYFCNRSFVETEMNVKTKCKSKPNVNLYNCYRLKFNGTIIKNDIKALTISQSCHIFKLSKLDSNNLVKQQLIAERSQKSNIKVICKPDVTYGSSILGQDKESTEQKKKDLCKFVKLYHKSHNTGLSFVPPDTKSIFIILLIDAGLATNNDMTLQLLFITVLTDEQQIADILHYKSTKSKRVTKSFLAVELFAITQGFGSCAIMRLSLNEMFGKTTPFNICTDSRIPFDYLSNFCRTSEKLFSIYLCRVRESY